MGIIGFIISMGVSHTRATYLLAADAQRHRPGRHDTLLCFSRRVAMLVSHCQLCNSRLRADDRICNCTLRTSKRHPH